MATKRMAKTKIETALRAVEARRSLLLSQVRSVCEGYTSALFVWGEGGLGKSHHIVEAIRELRQKDWVHHTSYSTPKGLMLSIAKEPSTIHLFEDCEGLYKAEVSSSILRAACGSPNKAERIVTYETNNEKYCVRFSGGIIIVSNKDLSSSSGPLAAVASRFRPIVWSLTLEERLAVIYDIASRGWTKGTLSLEPEECLVVADHLYQMTSNPKMRKIDLRLFTEHALPVYAQWLSETSDGSASNWKSILESKVSGSLDMPLSRGQKTEQLKLLAQQILTDEKLTPKEKVAKWKEETGLGQAIYYRYTKGN